MTAVGAAWRAASWASGAVGAAALAAVAAQRGALRRWTAIGRGDPNLPTGPIVMPPPDRSYTVDAAGGVALHVEEVGSAEAPATAVFAHGWTLNLGSWYFQRTGLADCLTPAAGGAISPWRFVFFDQRSHGRSSRAPRRPVTLDDLADDLLRVIATSAPDGPIVLVGHSMGGMAILALVGRHPDLVGTRIRGAALISTSASETDGGISRLGRVNGSNPLIPPAATLLGRYPRLVEAGRGAARGPVWLATRALGFAAPDVPGAVVDYADAMISATPIDVIASFASAVFRHDLRSALPNLAGIPTLVAVGEDDRMTPPSRSESIAAALPQAETLVIPHAGHLAILEAAPTINAALRRLLHRSVDGSPDDVAAVTGRRV